MLQVGSAGHLRHSNLGAQIDAHDVVLRFNDAPAADTAEEELGRHVGSRTTHRLLHAASSIVASLYTRQGWAKNASKTENLIFRGDWKEDVALFRRLHHLEPPPSAGEGESNNARTRRGTRDGRAERNLWILSTGFNMFVWRWVGAVGFDKVPTSGMLGIMWALHTCDQVHTYGFGPLPRHYQPEHRDVGGGGGAEDARRARKHAPPPSSPNTRPLDASQYRYYENAEAERLGDGDASSGDGWAGGHRWDREEALHEMLAEAGLVRRHWSAH